MIRKSRAALVASDSARMIRSTLVQDPTGLENLLESSPGQNDARRWEYPCTGQVEPGILPRFLPRSCTRSGTATWYHSEPGVPGSGNTGDRACELPGAGYRGLTQNGEYRAGHREARAMCIWAVQGSALDPAVPDRGEVALPKASSMV